MIIKIALKSRAIISLIALLLFLGCAGTKSKSILLKDIYSVDVIILENMEWRKFTKREHKDLDNIMRSKLSLYLDDDFEVYEQLESAHARLTLSFSSIDSLTKEMIKVVKEMKRSKTTDLDQFSKKSESTFRTILKRESDAIKKYRSQYDQNKLKLKKIFKNLNQTLIFIKQEVAPMENQLPNLIFKRKEIRDDWDKYMNLLNQIVFKDSKPENADYIIEASKKIEKWRNQLDSFEKFIQNLNSIARKEAGGFVLLRSSEAKPMKYIKRYNQGIEDYHLNIEKIHNLIKSF